MAKVITATQAAELINDNVTLGFAVSALAGWPEEVALAIRERFLKTGHPRGLTLTHGRRAGRQQVSFVEKCDHDWRQKTSRHVHLGRCAQSRGEYF